MQSTSHKLLSQLISPRTVESASQSISQRYICKSFSVLVSFLTVESVTQHFSESVYYPVSPQPICQSINQPQIVQSDSRSLDSRVSYSVNQPPNSQSTDIRVSYNFSQSTSHRSLSQLFSSQTLESVIQSINQP